MSHDTKYCSKQIVDNLLGFTVIGVVESPSSEYDEGFFGLRLMKEGKQKVMWIQSDAEGNDSGWIDIEDLP